MAVSSMKKLSVVTMREDTDSLLYDLQRLRAVNLQRTNYGEDLPEGSFFQDGVGEQNLTEALAKGHMAIDFLSRFCTKQKGLFAPPVEKEWQKDWPDGIDIVEKACSWANEMERLKARANSLAVEREGLLPWKKYPYPLPVSETESTKTMCGLLSAGADRNLLSQMLETYACVLEEIGADKTVVYVSITCWKAEESAISSVLSGFGFLPAPVQVTLEEGCAAGRLISLQKDIQQTDNRIEEIRTQAVSMADKLPLLELYVDCLTTMQVRRDAAQDLFYTKNTAMLTGWVPEKMVGKVQAVLDKRGDAYRFEDPAEDDDVPVLLVNNAMAAPFEPVVALYSLPAYGTFDPTFVMSFFYIIIFGLMFADVGYGLLLVLACLAGLRFMHPSGGLKKFLAMFAMCGASMIVMGVLFGGYLGDLPQAIAQNFGGRTEPLDLALWFNPLNDPMTFLVVSIGIGAIHLFAGLAVQFYILWTCGKKTDAVCDAGSWMLLFIGVGVSFLYMPVGLGLVALGLLMLICTQGRHEKNPIMKIVKGVMSLYNIVNYVSDLLSYSRILSLGLASAVIASVFNIIGTMAGPSVVGILMLIIVGTIGHAMNLAINLLGSFVHTSRLQYIEFFGKFYETGGRPYVPLAPVSKYVHLKTE